MRIHSCLIAFLLLHILISCEGQDTTLLKRLNDSLSQAPGKRYVMGTFKALYIVNTQTVEGPAKQTLVFMLQHRFGTLNSGIYNFFGLDNATLRFGFDYGITDRLTVGVGRSSYLKTYDGYVKFKILRQTDGSESMPLTASLLVGAYDYTLNIPGQEYVNNMYRVSYSTQLLIARKFSRILSFQIAPTWLHYNLTPTSLDKSNVFGLGFGGRVKITNRMSINAEYDYLPTGQIVSAPVHNSFSLGWDIETGGHVFQLVFTNSQSLVPTQYFAQTPGSWGKGDIYFGFNLSRSFNLKKKTKSVY